MALEIIKERLRTYYKLDPEYGEISRLEFALKEIMQEISLRALAKSGFFKEAAFQGGTCLRIMHKMQRFSEDMNFTLKAPSTQFDLTPHTDAVTKELLAFGIDSNFQDKGRANIAVAKNLIRTQSVDKILNIESKIGRLKKIRIKIEIDTNPPAGGGTTIGQIMWPSGFSIVLHDLSTLFAGKLHALICRGYEKGRDWYDLLWYVQRKTQINFTYLHNALVQTENCDKKAIVDIAFVKAELKKRLNAISLQNIKDDVVTLVNDRTEIDLWTKELFSKVIDEL